MFDSDEDGAKTEASAKTIERMYDSDGDLYMSNLLLKLKLKLKITLKKFLKLNPVLKLKLKPKIVSTPELRMNVKNFMKNLEIK